VGSDHRKFAEHECGAGIPLAGSPAYEFYGRLLALSIKLWEDAGSKGGYHPEKIEGVYRDGKVELTEVPIDVCDETCVSVTFLEP
jgi:hypothetical protein